MENRQLGSVATLCADEQKECPPLPGTVVAFFVILAPDMKLNLLT